MKILHVTIGSFKSKIGGLNHYCKMLVDSEKKFGHDVVYLYPGNISKKTKIKRVNKNEYFISGALPIPITYGIDDPKRYMKQVDINIYIKFLEEIKPDVIHIHSIQGIHKEFFEAAKSLHIKLVFTSHDYFLICCKANLICNGKQCIGEVPNKCAICNSDVTFSEKKQKLLQSRIYSLISNKKIIKVLKKKFTHSLTKSVNKKEISEAKIQEFKDYIEYKNSYINFFDVIHYNSELTKRIFNLKFDMSYVIPISILPQKNRFHTRYKNKKFVIAYLGGQNINKGYNVFENAINLLEKNNIENWEARFYGSNYEATSSTRKKYYGFFNSKESEKVWSEIDILVAPSICYETFGFVVIEALSRGIPVVCSNKYGSVDYVKSISEKLVFDSNDFEKCYEIICMLINESKYTECQNKIKDAGFDFDLDNHVKKMIELYNGIING